MLGMLFTAAPSNDVVRELQDKVIAIQDHEIAFLNGTIAIWVAATGIMVAIALVVIGFANNKAKKNMEDATKKLEDAEKKISDLESKIAEANTILTDAQSISGVAQEKLEELEDEQLELKKYTNILISNRYTDFTLEALKMRIRKVKNIFELAYSKEDSRYTSFIKKHKQLEQEYEGLHLQFLSISIEHKIAPEEYEEKLLALSKSVDDILDEYDLK